MSAEASVGEIVASLTKAQRSAVLWCPDDGSFRAHDKSAPREVSFWALANVVRGDPTREVARIYKLTKYADGGKRAGQIWPDRTWALTPLGLAVHAHLNRPDAEKEKS